MIPLYEFVFVYGTLKTKQPNHNILLDKNNGQATYHAKGVTVNKYPLIISGIYNIPYLLDKQGTGNLIEGEIYKVDSDMLSYLDKFEGVPSHYERINIKIETIINEEKSEILNCYTYVKKNFTNELLKENDYLSNYIDKHPKKYIPHQD